MSKALLSEIIKGAWMIEPWTALSHLPNVASFMEGKQIATIDRENEASHVFVNSEGVEYREREDADIQEGSVMVVNLNGTMFKNGTLCTWGADELVAKLQKSERDHRVIGSILRIDSGGGAVSAIAPFQSFLQGSRKKPVVALCDMAASAAYYSAVFTDHIMAENKISSEFGSIGVMCQFADFSKYYEENGIKVHTIYSNLSQNKNEEFHKALEGQYDLIKEESLDPLARKFQNDVKERRPGLNLDTQGVLNGKMFYAEKALEIGLIDSIGSLEDAIKKVKELSTSANKSIINKNEEPMTLEELRASHPALYNQVHSDGREAGKKDEQIRVNSWLAHLNSDSERVVKAIKDGSELTADVREELLVSGQMKQRTSTKENAKATDTTVEAGKEMEEALREDVEFIKSSL